MQSLVVIPLITSKERVSPHVSKFTKAGQDVICALTGLGVGVYRSSGVSPAREKFLG